jgi:hypothetical protein
MRSNALSGAHRAGDYESQSLRFSASAAPAQIDYFDTPLAVPGTRRGAIGVVDGRTAGPPEAFAVQPGTECTPLRTADRHDSQRRKFNAIQWTPPTWRAARRHRRMPGDRPSFRAGQSAFEGNLGRPRGNSTGEVRLVPALGYGLAHCRVIRDRTSSRTQFVLKPKTLTIVAVAAESASRPPSRPFRCRAIAISIFSQSGDASCRWKAAQCITSCRRRAATP